MFEIEEGDEGGPSVDRSYIKDVELARLVERTIENFPGPVRLKNVLTKPKKSATFVKALEKYKEENEIQIESLSSALNLLDMHKIPRSAFSSQAAVELLGVVHARLQQLGDKSHHDPTALSKLEKFVPKIFPLHVQKEFRPLIIDILAHLPKVNAEYIDTIAHSAEFYAECPVSVLRHVWLRHNNLFYTYIQPIIMTYYKSRMYEPFNIDYSKLNFFTLQPAKERRKCPEVRKLLELVGNEFKLYKRLLHFIRVCFEESGDVYLCTLRAELIMACHDTGNEKFNNLDMTHEFAWCLDTCMRDRNLDSHYGQKLKAILDSLPPLHYIIVLDIAMICADPHVQHFLSGLIVRKIRENCVNHLLREMNAVILGTRILALGLSAQNIAIKKNVPERLWDNVILTSYLSALASCMLEDHMYTEGLLDPETNAPVQPTLIPSVVIKYIKVDRLAALIYLHYVLDLLPMKTRSFNKICLDRYALNLPLLHGNIAVEGLWGYLFVDRLIAVHNFNNFINDDPFWKRHLMTELIVPALLNSRDPIVKFNHLRLIIAIGYVWGTVDCMESFTKFHQLPLDIDLLNERASFISDMYLKAHKKVVSFLWRNDIVKPAMEEDRCKNGHINCEFHCPHIFMYGFGEEVFNRLDECYPGFKNPPYLNREGSMFYDSDDKEDYFHLVRKH